MAMRPERWIGATSMSAVLFGAEVTLLVAVCLVAAASAEPADQTAYGRSTVRLEWRPGPESMTDAGPRQETERGFAGGGVDARWISVVDPLGAPYYDSAFLPADFANAAENARTLKEWVAELHARGTPVMSWYPLIICRTGWQEHPDWRQQFIVPQPEGRHKDIDCCVLSDYGQALINFCNEAIDRFGLDGFWFDGSAWTQIWDRPIPLSCVCDACKERFRADTGLEAPADVNWSDPAFRRWVAWRYEAFGEYLGRLARGIHAVHPHATVVVNHYHRPVIPWQGAIPLNPYEADIITGSEATGEARVDLTMRLCRAYGRSQSEVWRPFDCAEDPDTAPQTDDLLHHALTCFAAGGMPSFGGGDAKLVGPTAAILAPIMEAIRPYVGGESYPYAALHLSQQTETFYLSRERKGADWSLEPYWQSIEGWTQGLGMAHIAPDYVYDRDLVPTRLRGYRALLLPMSLALSDEQALAIADYVRGGGLAVVGPGAGALDEWGEPRSRNPLGAALGYSFGGVPSPAADEWQAALLVPVEGGDPLSTTALKVPLALRGRGWDVLYRDGESEDAAPAIALRTFGRGQALVVNTDLGRTDRGWQPSVGGKTRLAVTDALACTGKHSLEFADDPDAPYPFCPDMEMRFGSFEPPRSSGGRLECDLRLGKGAVAAIELRSSTPPCIGPAIRLGDGGRLVAGDSKLAEAPPDTWLHVGIDWRFGPDGSGYDVTLTAPGEAPQVFRDLPCADVGVRRCDWAVIYSPGSEQSVFHVDNVRIERIGAADGQATAVLADDFETTPVGGVAPTNCASVLARLVRGLAPPEIEVEAPQDVRVGMFRAQDGGALVHLHNLDGTHATWRKDEGPPVRIRSRQPVRSAVAAVSGRTLPIVREGDQQVVTVPHVGLYEVVKLSP